MADKKYSPKEAALAVLQKAQELFQLSPLAKGEWNKIHNKLEKEGYSKESADKIDGSIKAKMNKSEDPMAMGMSEKNPDEKQDAQLGEQVENDVHAHEATASDPGQHAEPEMKGHIKLAKFMGRMEHKKGQKAASEIDKSETGHEKGVATADDAGSPGTSAAGGMVRTASNAAPGFAKDTIVGNAKKASVGRMMENSQIKPKLPG